MKNLLLVGVSALIVGCASKGSMQELQSAIERHDAHRAAQLAEEAARQTRARQQQEELRRQMAERERRASEFAQVNHLSELGIKERALEDAARTLQDEDSFLSQRSLYYGYDTYDIRADYHAMIEAHAKFLADHPDQDVRIEGNCDERGSREYNLALGQRRADAVKRALTMLGVSANQLTAVSLGAEKPRVRGHEEGDHAQNRRSDLVYTDIDVQN